MIDRDDLLDLIDTNDIKEIMKDLGSNYCNDSKSSEIIFSSICHDSNSHKLYYYPDTKLFHCYSRCGTMTLYDLIMQVLGFEKFIEAFNYVLKFKGISNNGNRPKGLKTTYSEIQDMEFLRKHKYDNKKKNYILPSYDNNILKVFDEYYPSAWEEEGLTPNEMQYFGIRFYFSQYKAIIPIRDINGNLIGIRGRAFYQWEVDSGKKYMPVTIQNITYRYPTGMSLYGIYENQYNIKRLKRCIFFEGEKSVIKYGSYYGRENNIALASFGTTISKYHRMLVLNLGIREITIAYDKQYIFSLIEKKDKDSIEEYNKYIKKIMKIYNLFNNYCLVSLVYCDNDKDLEYKDAPIDQGKETFTKLYQDRILINDIKELEGELIEV